MHHSTVFIIFFIQKTSATTVNTHTAHEYSIHPKTYDIKKTKKLSPPHFKVARNTLKQIPIFNY
ncbi:hypothetical protein ACIN8IBEIGE_160091 [Acinetobacter sp. 8I-beige]|nr:hypothetical protein ACIN8IBEIGE_160091 [Acinetobacter sp. 8I-beige]